MAQRRVGLGARPQLWPHAHGQRYQVVCREGRRSRPHRRQYRVRRRQRAATVVLVALFLLVVVNGPLAAPAQASPSRQPATTPTTTATTPPTLVPTPGTTQARFRPEWNTEDRFRREAAERGAAEGQQGEAVAHGGGREVGPGNTHEAHVQAHAGLQCLDAVPHARGKVQHVARVEHHHLHPGAATGAGGAATRAVRRAFPAEAGRRRKGKGGVGEPGRLELVLHHVGVACVVRRVPPQRVLHRARRQQPPLRPRQLHREVLLFVFIVCGGS